MTNTVVLALLPSWSYENFTLNSLFGNPDGYINKQSNSYNSGEALWLQYTVGVIESGNSDFMKLSLSFSFANVKLGLVFRTINTLLLLALILSASSNVARFLSFLQTDGWPLHSYPFSILHSEEHPSLFACLPSSHCSVPSILAFPQTSLIGPLY